MATTEQTYKTHVHRPVLSTIASVLAIVALSFAITAVRRQSDALAWGLLCLAGAVIVLVMISRIYIVRLQDRIILLEMRVRLARLGLEPEYARLAKSQIIALRFASDAELPGLLQRAIAEKLTGRQIKEAVQSWQPDYHRT